MNQMIMIGLVMASVVGPAGMTAQSPATEGLVPVPGTGGQWLVDQAARAGDVRLAPFAGRPALWLRNNTAAIRSGVRLLDGVIEFDVAPMEEGHFFGVEFRRQRFGAQENIYFRVRDTAEFNAIQYAPRINRSSTWQLYPEFSGSMAFPRSQWTHVRIHVSGTRLVVQINGDPKPALVVERMRGGYGEGDVAFWARVNGKPTRWAAAVANLTIGGGSTPSVAAPPAQPAPPGVLNAWSVAEPIRAESAPVFAAPAPTQWRPVTTEEDGLVNLNRAFGPLTGRWTAAARTTLRAASNATVPLDLAFSDDVTVFLNGQPIFRGVNGWESRYPGYLGLLQRGFQTVFLPLVPGSNELLLAVTDDMRFGWGFSARIPPDAPVDILP